MSQTIRPGGAAMTIALTCPGCSATSSVADEATGQLIACPRCNKRFRVVPAPASRSAGAAAPGSSGHAPSVVGRYRVRRKVGSGAFGAVYRAYDPTLDREVALKLLRPE